MPAASVTAPALIETDMLEELANRVRSWALSVTEIMSPAILALPERVAVAPVVFSVIMDGCALATGSLIFMESMPSAA